MDNVEIARRTAELQLGFEESLRAARGRAERRAAVAETLAESGREHPRTVTDENEVNDQGDWLSRRGAPAAADNASCLS